MHLLRILLLLALAPVLHAADYVNQYKNTDVAAVYQRKKYILKGVDGDSLVAVMASAPDAEIYLPFDSFTQKMYFKTPDDFLMGMKMLSAGKGKDALGKMRETGYSMLPYLYVPTKIMDTNSIVLTMMDAIVEAGEAKEGYDLINTFDFDEIDERFIEKSFQVIGLMVSKGMSSDALNIVKKVPLNSSRKQFLPQIIQVGGHFREYGKYEEALEIYQRAERFKDTDEYKMVLLWIAYLKERLNDRGSVQYYLDQIGESFRRGQPEYSLNLLVRGLILMNDEKFPEAMELIAKAAVQSDRSYMWMPEVLFSTGFLYHKLEKPEVALNVYDEIKLFYPESIWAKRSIEEIGKIERILSKK